MLAVESLKLPSCDFSDATLAQLISLVLGLATTLDDCQAIEDRSQSLLTGLAQQDPVFAAWLSVVFPGTSEEVQLNPAGHQISWDQFLGAVLQWNQTSVMAGIARQAASTVLRLRLLQSRFHSDLQLSKREAIYHLAYGLSHELNNPLANISARAGVLLTSCKIPDQRHMLETVIDSASRGSEMLGDLMLIARPPTPQYQPVDLSAYADRVREKGSYWAGFRGIGIDFQWQATQNLNLDPALLSEIIWALLRNAIEASPNAGTVRLKAWVNGKLLQLQIDDQGPGLTGQALRHCFDPYFSGREAGRGLGMGLAKARRLAEIHGGDVTIENLAVGGCRATAWIISRP